MLRLACVLPARRWLWLAILAWLGGALQSSYAQVDEAQVYALLDFRSNVMADPNATLADWQAGVDPCTFTGVTCGNITAGSGGATSDVIQINLASSNLTGTISPSLVSLSKLQALYLHDNHFSGPIPEGLEKLANLLLVDVSNNALSGTVPPGLITKRGLKLNVDGNPNLCDPRVMNCSDASSPFSSSPPPTVNALSSSSGGGGLSGGAIFGITLLVLVLTGAGAGGACYWFKVHRKKSKASLNFERFTGMDVSEGERL